MEIKRTELGPSMRRFKNKSAYKMVQFFDEKGKRISVIRHQAI
jgi:hypothetical protein